MPSIVSFSLCIPPVLHDGAEFIEITKKATFILILVQF